MPDPVPPTFLDASGNPIPEKAAYRLMATTAAQSAGLDPDFVGRLVDAESGGNPHAVSGKGALGLMQVMPATAKQYGVYNLMDPAENIKAGVSYLKDLSAKYPNRPDLVAAAYNAGPGAVDRAGGVPNFKETQAYVQKVAPPSASNAPPEFLDEQGNPVVQKTKDKKGEVIFSNAPSTNVGLAAGAAVKSVPLAENLALRLATNPNAAEIGSKIGRVIGGVTSLPGGLSGFGDVQRGVWAGGKSGWFTAKLAQDVARPISRVLEAAGPYASLAFKASALQSALDLAQTAEPNRKDIGVLGMAIGDKTDPQHPALINAIWDHLVSVVKGDDK